MLADVVDRLGLPYVVQPGAGANYGPKHEIVLRDRRGRAWQCGTIPLDFVKPERFDVRDVDAGGEHARAAGRGKGARDRREAAAAALDEPRAQAELRDHRFDGGSLADLEH